MITEMALVNITGPRDDIDRMADQYLSHYNIHLVNTLKELSGIQTLHPYTSPNPYTPWEERLNTLLSISGNSASETRAEDKNLSFDEIQSIIEKVEEDFKTDREAYRSLEEKVQQDKHSFETFEPFSEIEFSLEDILSMKKIKFRFGRFTVSNYNKYRKYVEDSIPSIFVPSKEKDGFIYGVYFTPAEARQRVDTFFYSLAWERIYVPEEKGTLKEISDRYQKLYQQERQEEDKMSKEMNQNISPDVPKLLNAKKRLASLSSAWNIRKFAAITRDEFSNKETRYLVIGWMSNDDARELYNEARNDDDVTIVIESDKDNEEMTPPTKLKNNFFVKPFELITRMYGMPNYHEMDPTDLVAITYSLLFGAMFGDTGQGLLLALLGLLGYVIPKLSLAKLFVPVGISSMFFGLVYGSFFGFENVIRPLWGNPSTEMMTIPFFGQLNTVFIVSVIFGMFMIMVTIGINILSKLKVQSLSEVLLDRNGIFGLGFYGLVVLLMVLYFSGHPIPALSIILFLMLFLIFGIAFKEPILSKLHHEGGENSESVVIQGLSIFFETFETLLTYFSNTISFVRVGAFAISHGAMMGVVLMFANVESGNPNWLVIILGNLFVVGFEGLVVFIQVLRLEFYEIFSHFYQGDGVEFRSTLDQNR